MQHAWSADRAGHTASKSLAAGRQGPARSSRAGSQIL